jgi:hypothetical protein
LVVCEKLDQFVLVVGRFEAKYVSAEVCWVLGDLAYSSSAGIVDLVFIVLEVCERKCYFI